MKILLISFEAPSEFSGGGLGIKQSIESLAACGDVDYIGPAFDKSIIKSSNFNVQWVLNYSNSIIDKLYGAFHGVTSGYYSSWKKYTSKIEWEKYDLVSVEFTRYPFLIKEAKRYKKNVITRVHNVENDYFKNLYYNSKSLLHLLQYKHYSKEEKKSVNLSNVLLALTQEDKNRLCDLYGSQLKRKIIINPVCLNDTEVIDKGHNSNLLITGSLWYGPNADGVLWFLQNVWKKIYQNVANESLIIAGSNPNEKIELEARKYNNVILFKNPEDMTPFFNQARCYIAPVFSGAGMKVKVAEALKYGLPVIASQHALIGYKKSEMIFECDSEDKFSEAISNILKKTSDEIDLIKRRQRELFATSYSMQVSVENYKKAIDYTRRT